MGPWIFSYVRGKFNQVHGCTISRDEHPIKVVRRWNAKFPDQGVTVLLWYRELDTAERQLLCDDLDEFDFEHSPR
jgi:hypothetical protein